MLRECKEIRQSEFNDCVAVLRLAVLNDMLSHVVSVLVREERSHDLVKLAHKDLLILPRSIFEHSLDDSASEGMLGILLNRLHQCRHDEIEMPSRNQLDGFLYNVIAILIFNDLDDLGLKLSGERSLLLIKDMLKSLKHSQY